MLMDALWPETIVQEANLAVAISQLRKAINTNRDRGEFIQTISRVGYRFVADVRTVEEQPIPLNATQQADVIIDENNKAVSPVEQLSPERSQAVVARAKPRKTLRLRLLVAAGSILALAAVVWLIRERFLVSRSVLAREKSIAVLPFENLSADSENVFFADGIQD